MAQPTKQWGLTPPMSTSLPTPLDNEKNAELVEELKKNNNYETHDETQKRIKTLRLLNQANREFVREAGRRQGLPQNQLDQLGGKIYPYGSYRLGVYGPGSDIDTLAVAPKSATREQFFEFFPDILRRIAGPEAVTSCTAVPDAFVPIIKLVVNGIEIDLIFASLNRQTIPSDFELRDNKILDGLDEATIRAVTGPRVTDTILELVPEQKTFRTALRAIKLWAQRRAIYANIVGYPGGVAWAMLVGRVCQMYPKAIGATLVHKFFNVLKHWNWPTPVQLQDIEKGPQRTWNPQLYPGDKKNLMPVITPAYPSMCATFNITLSNKAVILREIDRGFKIAGDIFEGKAQWADLLKKHTFFTKDHKYYLSIITACQDSQEAKAWSGAVESKIRHFVGALDLNTKMIMLARPFIKAVKRQHQCENEEQVRQVRRGEMKYKIAETTMIESTDPDLVAAGGAGTATNGDDAAPAKIDTGIPVYTYTFYIGIDPTPLLEQTRNLDIHVETKMFKDRCYTWDKIDPSKHFLEVVPCKGWMLPDDLFDTAAGEVVPSKPSRKRKLANGDTSVDEPPAKRLAPAPNGAPAASAATPPITPHAPS
ncbi:polynucleotide adenylyltransferase [Lithohypha guttulata]|uniref:polynucleotide adenylyltransferase n=1 Tax=Lithohypha guttulata TaxID=1690604 RepID=UPI002DE0ADAC|nr:polynucleotide adenylyltransferase [Lithohypha guttulata]KAK5097589.1 polynucleotide adenylyltransferase [Lithohypha guttulata]